VIEGLNIAAGGMIAQQQRLDAVAENVANADTDGFQAVRTELQDTGSGVTVSGLTRDVSAGPLQATGQPLDIAVVGDGYLQVRQANGGIGLTRAGNLQLDRAGRLTAATGAPLVPPIQVPPGTDPSQIAIAPNGAVSAQGRALGSIGLVTVPAPGGLLAAGDGLLSPTVASGGPIPAPGATLQQGALEGSNTDIADSMVDLVDAKTSFEASVVAARTADETAAAALDIVR